MTVESLGASTIRFVDHLGRISIFALSTYDTDYILVGEHDAAAAVAALRAAGHEVEA